MTSPSSETQTALNNLDTLPSDNVREFSHVTVEVSEDLSLEMSLLPPTLSAMHATTNSLAVLLHPWSWLGGNMDDPNFYVVTYNGRGVGKSSGWASFTGLQEVKDLKEVVKWSLSKISNVGHVLILGYSYGSLITSLHPVLPPPIKTSHILLSYPLDKRGLLTLFHTRTYANGLSSLVRDPNSNVLIAFGDRDQFTGIDSYEHWAAQLADESAKAQSDGKRRVEVVYVQGASHFWEERQARTMHNRVESWLDTLNI